MSDVNKVNLILCSLLALFNFVVRVSTVCDDNGKRYKSGDHWHGEKGCELNVCGSDSTITTYKKVCPPISQCLPSKVYMKDCCRYCKNGDKLDTKENGDRSNGYETHSCKRTCISGRPMTCKYSLKVELYESCNDACFNCPFNLTDCSHENCVPLDGVSRLVVATNRMIPGPAIHVCVGDTIVADVENGMLSQGLTMHWHGISQRHTPYMDGVPHITQCPIEKGNVFRYTFPAYDPGTYFYHPHTGAQVTDGCAGLLIIRQPDSENPLRRAYDKDLYEHVLAIQDWQHLYSEDVFTRLYFVPNTTILPDNLLINGRGRILSRVGPKLVSSVTDPKQAQDKLDIMPFSELTVEKGLRYRIRILNAASQTCPISISIDNHNLTVISTDGFDVAPFEVQEIISNDAERYDIVLHANQKVGNYWIRIKGLFLCQSLELQQFAILRYKGSSKGDPKESMEYNYPKIEGIRLGNVPSNETDNKTVKVSELRGIQPLESGVDTPNPDYTFYIRLSYNQVDNNYQIRASPEVPQARTLQLNNITLDLPPTILLTDPETIQDPSVVCNETYFRNTDCMAQQCSCVYTYFVKLNSIVEVIMYNDGTGDSAGVEHPMHYHGYTFRVVAMERLPGLTEEKLKQMNRNGKIKRNFNHPTPKDSIIVYNPGYTIYRFKASNPGIWLLHCHQQFHLTQGKGLFIRVGEQSDLPPAPPQYPDCRNYLPK